MTEIVSEDESDDDDAVAPSKSKLDQADESTNYTESELKSLRQQVDDEIKAAAIKSTAVKPPKFDSIANYIQSVSTELGHVHITPDVDDQFEDALDATLPTSAQPIIDNTDAASVASGVSSNDLQEATDDLADLDPNSREYRFKMVEKILSDARSHRSYSTTASTIAPSVIKDKIKRTIELKEQRDVRKRCLAKGEANATTRGRKENKDTVKEYAGWDF